MKLKKNKSTPKRLKDVVPLVDKLLWRHSKCPYKLLLDKFCPSKVLLPTFEHSSPPLIKRVEIKKGLNDDPNGVTILVIDKH
jgi:hypothetical protein